MSKGKKNRFEDVFVSLVLEAIDLEKTGPKKISIQDAETGDVADVDISNFIFQNTNGGTEPVTLVGVRARDSKSDPSKKAGDEIKINGRLKYRYSPTGGPSPIGDAQQRYKNYDIITLMVNSVDGKAYPRGQIRNIKANTINKISMGGKVYNILT